MDNKLDNIFQVELKLEFYTKLRDKLGKIKRGDLDLDEYIEEVSEKIGKISQKLHYTPKVLICGSAPMGDSLQYAELIRLSETYGNVVVMSADIPLPVNRGVSAEKLETMLIKNYSRDLPEITEIDLIGERRTKFQHNDPPKRRKSYGATNNRKKTKRRRKR